jgi:hypothetical protein
MQTDLAELERRLWDAADELRANSGLKASEYGTPVLGLIFLRFADAKFKAASAGIEAKASARRTVGPSDYHAQRVLYLTETARFDHLLALPEGTDLGKAVNDAMRAVEEHNPELAGVLPKTYTSIENTTIASLLRHINSYTKDLEGDAFGLIYEDVAMVLLYSGGAPPYGYRLEDKQLVIDANEAAVVRRIFADYCNGVGQRGIVRSLNDDGAPPGVPWHQSSISRLLASPTYLGKIEFKGEVLPGAHDPIIDQDTWDRVQAIRQGANRRRGGRHADSRHLLTRGTLRCPECGSAMLPRKARPGVERERYVCGGRIDRGPAVCSQPSIRRELIDEPFQAPARRLHRHRGHPPADRGTGLHGPEQGA